MQHSYLQYKFTDVIHKLFEVHGVFIKEKHSLLKLKQIFTVRLKVSCRRPFHLFQENRNQFFIYRNNRKYFLWILYTYLVFDISLVYTVLYMNFNPELNIKICINFKMSTYLSTPSIMHSYIEIYSQTPFSQSLRVSQNYQDIQGFQIKRFNCGWYFQCTSNVFQILLF